MALALRRSSAAIRHLIWSLAIIGSLALPALAGVLPGWRTPLLAGIWPVSPGVSSSERVETAAPVDRGGVIEEVGVALDRRGMELDAVGESLDRGGDRLDAGEQAPKGAVIDAADRAAAAVPLVWFAGVALVLLLLIGERLRVWRLASRSRPVRDRRLLRRRDVLGRRLGLARAPRLLEAESAAMPMTWGFWRPIILLPGGAGVWSDERLDAVLLHEMAHVRRRDYATQLAAGLACAVYWFNPLAWVAARRLRVEREHACDDAVLRAGSVPSGYAGELLEMARSLRCHPSTELAAMTMARPSQLTGRLLAVLDEGRSRRAVSRRLALSGAALLVGLLSPLAALRPGVGQAAPTDDPRPRVSETTWVPEVLQVPSCWDPRAPHQSRVQRDDPDGGASLLWYNNECRVQVQVRGEVEFADDFTRIVGISENGFLQIHERTAGVTRELEVRPGDAGPTFAWWVDGDRREFDLEGREWLAARLIPLIRRAGLAVEERVAWILEREGVAGVLDEVRIVNGDRTESGYLFELIDQAELEGAGLQNALSLAAEELGSDSRMVGFLLGVAERGGAPVIRLEPFWSAASTVGSDSDHSRLLLSLLEIVPASDDALERVLRSAERNIGSDSDMARLLTRLAGAHPYAVIGVSADSYWGAAATVGSDSEHADMLLRLTREEASPPLLRLALTSAAANIGSDSSMRRLLVSLAERYPALMRGELRQAYLSAAATVGSDSERRRVMSAVDGVD